MTERIENVIVLGRGVPEQLSDGRQAICVAGWCDSVGFVRLYPTRRDSPLKQWSIVTVDVERNPRDTRAESWKFPESRVGWENINDHMYVKGEYPQERRLGLMHSLQSGCVHELNERKVSLGVVRPVIKRAYLDENEMHNRAFQPMFEIMEDAGQSTKRDCFFEPRMTFLCGNKCQARQAHDQQVIEWGCYQWMLKSPGKEQNIWRNLHIGEEAYTHYFVVGNQAKHRTSFMVISVIRQKTTMIQPDMFALERAAA